MSSKIRLATGYEELLNHSILRSDSLNHLLSQVSSQCCAGGTADCNILGHVEF